MSAVPAACRCSPHRGGAEGDTRREDTLAALLDAVALDCEYVEVDVQRCRGGVHVLYHDDVVQDGEFFPARQIEACDANLVACHKTIAKLRGAAWAARRNLPLLVWTVDDPDELRTWLLDRRAWMITTNYPREAAELRREIARESGV